MHVELRQHQLPVDELDGGSLAEIRRGLLTIEGDRFGDVRRDDRLVSFDRDLLVGAHGAPLPAARARDGEELGDLFIRNMSPCATPVPEMTASSAMRLRTVSTSQRLAAASSFAPKACTSLTVSSSASNGEEQSSVAAKKTRAIGRMDEAP